MMAERKHFTITKDSAAARLDVYLSVRLGITRSAVKALIEKGKALVNGRAVKAGHALKEGESIEAILEPLPEAAPLAEAIPLRVIYEDADILVINKQAGLAVHPGAGRSRGTLVNALLNHTKDLSSIGGTDRPGIVHRLDMDTTGALVAAKNDQSHEFLSRQFKEHSVNKKYVALVWGSVKADEGEIAGAIGRSTTHRKKMSTGAKKSRSALTRFRVLKRYNGLTLLELTPETGRTHQIRVHLSSINHPVVGDPVYGLKKARPELSKPALDRIKGVRRQLLHAAALGFVHPASGEHVEFKAELPEDFAGLVKFFDETAEG